MATPEGRERSLPVVLVLSSCREREHHDRLADRIELGEHEQQVAVEHAEVAIDREAFELRRELRLDVEVDGELVTEGMLQTTALVIEDCGLAPQMVDERGTARKEFVEVVVRVIDE